MTNPRIVLVVSLVACAVSPTIRARDGGFGLPYEVDFTDGSGASFVPGGGISATAESNASMDLWTVGRGGALAHAGHWTSSQGFQPVDVPWPVGTTGVFVPGGGVAADVRVPGIGMVDVYALGDNGTLWDIGHFDGTRWQPPYQAQAWSAVAAGKFVRGGGVSAVSRTTDLSDTFTIGTDGCLWYAGGWDATAGFKAPFKWPGASACNFVPGGGIGAVSRSARMTDSWVIARDGHLWNAGSFDGRFHPGFAHPRPLERPFPPGAPVAVVSRDPSRVDVYSIDYDGRVWMVGGYVDATPIAPYPLPNSVADSFLNAPRQPPEGFRAGGIAANSRSPQTTDLWAIAPDGAAWNAGSWASDAPSVANPSTCSHRPVPAPASLSPAPPLPIASYAQRLGRLTTGPSTNAAGAGIAGADLGAAVERMGGPLSFFFGDTRWSVVPVAVPNQGAPWDGEDSWASTASSSVARNQMPALHYALARPPAPEPRRFAPIHVPDIDLTLNDTPQDAVALPDGRSVVFLGTGATSQGRQRSASTMAVTATADDSALPSLSLAHVVETRFFEYVSAWYEPSDQNVYIFGTGPGFRESDGVYLARARADCVQDRSSWTFLAGGDSPAFVTGENRAQALFTDPHHDLGETSVRKVGNQYVMLYQAGQQSPAPLGRGVYMRVSTSLAGTWSEPVRIWAPAALPSDGGRFAGTGYGTSMHTAIGTAPSFVPYDDGLAEPDASNPAGASERWGDFGGEYAPELVARWSGSIDGVTTLTYGLSLGNPYQVDLFQSVLTSAGSAQRQKPTGTAPEQRLRNASFAGASPLQGWDMQGGPFAIVDQCGGHFLTTYGSLGRGTMGSLQQDFVPGNGSKALCMSIWGGALDQASYGPPEPNVSVRLLHDGQIVRESRPRGNNMDPAHCARSDPGVAVAWDLSEFIGEKLTLEVHDSRSDGWGFIFVSPVTQGAQIAGDGICTHF